MKLACFRYKADPEVGGLPRLGVVVPGGILPAGRAGGPGDLPTLLADLDAGLERLRRMAAHPEASLVVPEAEVALAPPAPPAPKIVCVGLNYRRHAERTNLAVTAVPTFFAKFGNALLGHGGVIPRPAGVQRLDAEAELAIVIGRRARGVAPAAALGYVLGYTCANDVSARDLQFRTSQWFAGKVCDGFCPLGPYLVTAEEAGNPDDLALRGYRDGRVVQDSRTSDMIFTCAEIIAHASALMTLEPGDVLLTGTPEGTVLDRGSEAWYRDGEEMAVEIQGIGRLANRVAPA
jgi:2-keto-4-pentenoate hydratase/2-oxohepta-3-ene-1,7-dioic acid hydratase in catechol pathway